jgi:hypothetical protein
MTMAGVLVYEDGVCGKSAKIFAYSDRLYIEDGFILKNSRKYSEEVTE